MSERTGNETADNRHSLMTEQAFAVLGGGKIAYVKSIRSEDVHKLYPQAPELEPGMSLFALHAADGTPIIPVNYKFAIDIIAKDKKNKETRGSGDVKWKWDSNMVEVEKFSNVYHPTLRATKGGPWCATAELDEITSNELCLEFRY